MDVWERLEGIAIMAENVKKFAPEHFDVQPVSGFIDALCADLRAAANEWAEDDE